MFSFGTQQRNRQDFSIRHAKEMRILSRSNTSDQCHRANFKSSVTRCTVQPFSMNRLRHKPHKTPVFAITRRTRHRHTPPFRHRPLFKPSSASASCNRSRKKQSFGVPQAIIRLYTSFLNQHVRHGLNGHSTRARYLRSVPLPSKSTATPAYPAFGGSQTGAMRLRLSLCVGSKHIHIPATVATAETRKHARHVLRRFPYNGTAVRNRRDFSLNTAAFEGCNAFCTTRAKDAAFAPKSYPTAL